MGTQFKAGDRVKVVRKIEPPMWNSLKEMDKLIGTECVIDYVSYDGVVDIKGWRMHPACLELIPPSPTPSPKKPPRCVVFEWTGETRKPITGEYIPMNWQDKPEFFFVEDDTYDIAPIYARTKLDQIPGEVGWDPGPTPVDGKKGKAMLVLVKNGDQELVFLAIGHDGYWTSDATWRNDDSVQYKIVDLPTPPPAEVLKRCPACKEPIVQDDGIGMSSWVECPSCGMRGPRTTSKRESQTAWNNLPRT